MKFFYVRHGQTDWNLARKMQGGQTERPLNETGIQQAEETRKILEEKEFDIVIVSPMKRAIQTAEIILDNRNVPIITEERLRERKLGELEGNPVTEQCEEEIWDCKLNKSYKNGESVLEFEKRVLEFIEEAKEKYKDKTVLIVAHGGVAKVFKKYLYGVPKNNNLNQYGMKNCEIIEAKI